MIDKINLTVNTCITRVKAFYKQKIDNNRELDILVFFLLVALMGVLLFRLNRPTPWVVDDLLKSNGVKDLTSLGQWFNHAYQFYFNWGGRIWGEIFSLLFLSIPKIVFDYLNTIGYLIFVLLIYVNITGRMKASPSLFIFINFVLFACLPAFGQDILWISGCANYMWSSLIPLLFLACWRFYLEKPESYYHHPIFIIFMASIGILTGWANESVSIGILGILLLYMVLYKKQFNKYPTFSIIGIISVFIGTCFLWLAPGNFVRFAAEGHSTSILHILHRMLQNIVVLFDFNATLLLIIIFLILFIKGTSKHKILATNFVLGAVLVALVMGIVGALSNRTFLGCVVMMSIATGILYNDWYNGAASRKIKVSLTIAMLVSLSIFYSTARVGIVDYANRWDNNVKIIQVEKAKGNLDVYVNPITPKNKFCATYGLEDIKPKNKNQHWLNRGIATYYGLHTIQTVYIELTK